MRSWKKSTLRMKEMIPKEMKRLTTVPGASLRIRDVASLKIPKH